MKKTIETCKTNIRKGYKTTIIGVVLFASGLGLIIDQRAELTTTSTLAFGSMCLVGIGLLFSPDTFFEAIKKAIDKYLK